MTPEGAFSYSIPLRAPDGPGGLKPDLTLSYNSRGDNGLLGVGWQLTGISQITRCRKTLAADNIVEGVRHDNSDRFCLDGVKLRVTAGAYGASGSQYRTERADYAKIEAVGSKCGAPQYFKVWGKDGRIREYHALDAGELRKRYDSEGLVTKETPVSDTWQLRKVYDRVGNEVVYNYNSATVDGVVSDLFIEEISYSTGKRKIKFEYEDATSDNKIRFQNGVDHSELKRLKRIVAVAPNPTNSSEVWSYELEYDQSRATKRSRLRSVKWCDAAGVCLPATTFEWKNVLEPNGDPVDYIQNSSFGLVWESEPLDLEEHADWPVPVLADVNGDGLDDLLYNVRDPRDRNENYACNGPPGNYAKVLLRLGRGIRDTRANCHPQTGCEYRPFDAFGEAIDVSILFQPSEPGRRSTPFDPSRTRAGDFDGDGDQELLIYSDNSYFDWGQEHYRLFDWDDASQSLRAVSRDAFIIQNGSRPLHLADLDGDGRTDIMDAEQFDLRDQRWMFRSSFGKFQLGAPVDLGQVGCPNDVAAIDVGSDGRSELVMMCDVTSNQNGVNWSIGVSASGAREQGELGIPYAQEWRHADLNGDGLVDAYGLTDVGDFRVNTGNGYQARYTFSGPPPWVDLSLDDIEMPRFGDFNGDGRDDAILLHTGGRDFPTFCNTTRLSGKPALLLSDGATVYELEDAFNDFWDDYGSRWHNNGLISPRGWSANQLGDVDGNGIPELLTLTGDSPDEWRWALFAYQTDFGQKPFLTSEEHIFQVVDGLGEMDTVDYAGLASPPESVEPEGEFYVPGSDCTYPQHCLKRGLTVVTRHGKTNGGIGTYRRSWAYKYEDARADVGGRGFLGFKCVTVVDQQRGSVERTCADNVTRQMKSGGQGWVYPYAGLPQFVEIRAPLGDDSDRVRVTRTDYEWDRARWMTGDVFTTELASRTVSVREGVPATTDLLQPDEVLDDSFEQRRVTTEYDFDAYGNIELQVETRVAGNQTSVTRTRTDLDNFVDSRWLIGLPTYREVLRSRTGEPDQKRIERFGLSAATGLFETVTLEPDGGDLEYHRIYARGARGIVDRIVEQAPGMTERVTVFQHDEENLYVQRIENAEGHVSWQGTHPALGVPIISVDPNGVTTRHEIDGFGRVRRVNAPDSADTLIEYGLNGVAGEYELVPGVRQVVRSRTTGHDEVLVGYDSSDRARQVAWKTVDDQVASFESRLDVFGREISRELPFLQGEASAGKYEFSYDLLDRPLVATNPDGSVSTRSYPSFFESHMQDEEGKQSFVVSDVDAFIVESGSFDGDRPVSSTFTYWPFGNLHTVTDPLGNVVTTEYDRRGRRTKLIDPDAGVRKYWFNGFGEVRKERHGTRPSDPDSFLYKDVFVYDRLGRLKTKKNTCLVSGQCRNEGTRTFTWDTAANGIGALAKATTTVDSVTQTFGYDSFGRPSQESLSVGGETFTFDMSHDRWGRLQTLSYPTIAGQPRFQVTHSYQNGFLAAVERLDDQMFWQAQERTVEGAVAVEAQFAQGSSSTIYRKYEYNPLTRRVEKLDSIAATASSSQVRQRIRYGFFDNGQLETRKEFLEFAVDATEPSPRVTDTYDYEYANRLASWTRSGDGARNETYGYNDIGNLTTASRFAANGSAQGSDAYAYARTDGAGPHAATALGSVLRYRYDKGGRLKTRLASNQTELALSNTAFDLPYSVARTVSGTTTTSTLKYDAFEQRVVKDNPRQRTTYLSGLYEKRLIKANGGQPERTEHVFYVKAEGKVVAQVTQQGATRNVLYLHNDPLQSVSLSFDSSTGVRTRQYFSPWGERIDANGAVITTRPLEGLTRGYTGHEHDDELTLVNMGGRLYDPKLRRFLTPDPLSGVPVRLPLACAISPCDAEATSPASGDWTASQSRLGGDSASYTAETSTSSGSTASRLRASSRSADGHALGLAELDLLAGHASAATQSSGVVVPITQVDELNRYAYANNNPIHYRDPSGYAVETIWDIANIALGAASLAKNVSEGKYKEALVDAAGIVVDGAAAVVPFVPGGAGAALKTARAADDAVDAARAARAAAVKTEQAVQAAKKAEQAAEAAKAAKAAEAARAAEAAKAANGGSDAARGAAVGARAINLPGWSKVTVDMAHIAERHIVGGARTAGKTIFPGMNERGVMAAVRQAYGSATTVAVQGERVLLSGVTKTGVTVEMWLNKATNVIETAYPVVR